MITMAQRHGPWPACLGMSGDDCVSYIEANSKDLRGRVYIMKPGTPLTKDLQVDRVRVFVDDDGIVTKTPDRG